MEEITLRSGARGLLIDIPTATVMNFKVHFRAGLRYAKTPDLYEIAHVVEHLSFGANARYKDEQAYEAEFTKNGAYHNAWTSDYAVCYEAECADFEWERILELKRVAICEPRFNEEELKSEKGNVRAELTGYQNEYQRLLWPRLQKAVGEEAPSLSERLKTVSNIELKDIREHYRRTHTAKNMRFIIAGKLRHKKRKIIRMLEEWDLKEGEHFAIKKDELHSSSPILIRRKDASNLTFGFSFITPRRLDPAEFQSMCCLNHILCGTMGSRIFGQARKRGLVYGMGASLSDNLYSTGWDFDGEVNVENSEELFDLIQKELNQVLNGNIKDQDLAAAKSYGIGRYQLSAQTVEQIASHYANDYFLSGNIDHYDRIPILIDNIEKSSMVELAREFASSGIHALVAVGSTEKSVIQDLANRLEI